MMKRAGLLFPVGLGGDSMLFGIWVLQLLVTVWEYHISSYLLYEVSQCHACSSKGCLVLGPSQSGLSLRYRQVNLPASAKPLVFSVNYGLAIRKLICIWMIGCEVDHFTLKVVTAQLT